jgi:hypothetical protein
LIDAWGHHAHQQRTSISVTVQPSLGLLIWKIGSAVLMLLELSGDPSSI